MGKWQLVSLEVNGEAEADFPTVVITFTDIGNGEKTVDGVNELSFDYIYNGKKILLINCRNAEGNEVEDSSSQATLSGDTLCVCSQTEGVTEKTVFRRVAPE